jgi:hypothetical protein
MSVFSDSYVSRVLLAIPTSRPGLQRRDPEMALASDHCVRSVPARALLYARTRSEMPRQTREMRCKLNLPDRDFDAALFHPKFVETR